MIWVIWALLMVISLAVLVWLVIDDRRGRRAHDAEYEQRLRAYLDRVLSDRVLDDVMTHWTGV